MEWYERREFPMIVGLVMLVGFATGVMLPRSGPTPEPQPDSVAGARLEDLPSCASLTEPSTHTVPADVACREGDTWSRVGVKYRCKDGRFIIWAGSSYRQPVAGIEGGLWYQSPDGTLDNIAEYLKCELP